MFKAGAFFFFFILWLVPYLFGQENASTDTYLLRYQFPVGQETRYQLDISDWEKIKMGGKVTQRTQNMMLEFTQRVEGVDENGNGIWHHLYTDASYQGKKINLAGKEVRVRISPTGDILESEGLQGIIAEFVKVAMKSFSAYIPGLDRLPLKIDPSKFSSNEFNILYQSFVPTFPEGPLKTGDTWQRREGVTELADKRAARINYRLEEVKDGLAKITLVPPDIDSRKEGRKVSAGGEISFDIQKGELAELETVLELENFDVKGSLPSELIDTKGQPAPTYSLNIVGKKTTFYLHRLTN